MYLPNHLYKIGGTSLKNTLFFPYTPIFTPPLPSANIYIKLKIRNFLLFFLTTIYKKQGVCLKKIYFSGNTPYLL